jgi:hypothetical protein
MLDFVVVAAVLLGGQRLIPEAAAACQVYRTSHATRIQSQFVRMSEFLILSDELLGAFFGQYSGDSLINFIRDETNNPKRAEQVSGRRK